MTSTARNFNFDQDDLNQQYGLDIDAHSHNLAIKFAENSGLILGNDDKKTFENILREVRNDEEYSELTVDEINNLVEATLFKFKRLLDLNKKRDLLEKDKTSYSKFEKERFIRTMSSEIPDAANDNASIKHKIKKALGMATDLTPKKAPHYKGVFSTEAANDVETIKGNDALRDDSYFQARTLGRIEGKLRELENEALISEKSADKLTSGFESMKGKMDKIGSVIDDYEKILMATAGYDPNNSSPLRRLMVNVDTAYYKAPNDSKYSEAYLLQAILEKNLINFENNLRSELGLDQIDEETELDNQLPSSGVELLEFQKRQTRISELTAGIEELIKEYRRRNAKSIDAQKKNLSKHSDRIKKEKSAAEKRAEKWEDVRQNEVIRVFWYEFGNHVMAIKQHKANLARISAKGRNVYESHLDGIMSEYLSLREEVQAFEEAMGLKGFMNCLDAEFGQIKVKNSVIELAKVRADIERAKVKMVPRTDHKAPPMPDIEPPEMDDVVPDSGTRKKKQNTGVDTNVVDGLGVVDGIGNDNSFARANDNKADTGNKLPDISFDDLEKVANTIVTQSDYARATDEMLAPIESEIEVAKSDLEPVLADLSKLRLEMDEAQTKRASNLNDLQKKYEQVSEAHENEITLNKYLVNLSNWIKSIREQMKPGQPVDADTVIEARLLNFQTTLSLAKDGEDIKSGDPQKFADLLMLESGGKLETKGNVKGYVVIELVVGAKKAVVKLDSFGLPHLFLIEADGKEVKVLNSVEKKQLEEAQKAEEEKAKQAEAQRLAKEALDNAEAARIVAEKAEADRLALEAANAAEKARKDAEAAALGNPDKVINDTKGRIDKGIETKEILLPSETLYLGDLHGNYRVFEETVVNVLKLATKGADGNLVWVGGNRKFNDLGDIVFDRVTESFQILRQMRNLRVQAAKEGGRVEVVAGNHEDFAIGFFMGGPDMLDAFRNAMRTDSAGNRQGAGIYEFFAKYTAMGRHHAQYEGLTRDPKKTLPETAATLWEKLIDLRNSHKILDELETYRKEILANMAKDAEGLEILEELARLKLVLADDGVSISIHTEPTDQILASLTNNTNERAGVEKNVTELNAKFRILLEKLFLKQTDLSDEEKAELNELRNTFIYTDNRNFKAYYEEGQINKDNLKALADAGYKVIVHGHTDLNYAISFRTAEGIEIVNTDRSVGKTAGTGVGIESSTAVMYKDGKIETGLPEYKNLKEFNYTTKATADWLEEVFSLSSDADTSKEAQKLTETIGANYPEEIGARLNIDALKYLISTFAIGNMMQIEQKLPLKTELIKPLIDLYHEWIADDLKSGGDIKKIVAEMIALKAPIADLAAAWRAKKAKDLAKPEKANDITKEDKENIKNNGIEATDDTVVVFEPTELRNKNYNKLTDAEHTQNQVDALASFQMLFGKLSDMQIRALAEAIDSLPVPVQKRIVYNMVNFSATINAIFTGELGGVKVFGAAKGLPKNIQLFQMIGGLETKNLDILKDTVKLEMATRALNSLKGQTVEQIRKKVQPAFRNKTVLEWLAKLK